MKRGEVGSAGKKIPDPLLDLGRNIKERYLEKQGTSSDRVKGF